MNSRSTAHYACKKRYDHVCTRQQKIGEIANSRVKGGPASEQHFVNKALKFVEEMLFKQELKSPFNNFVDVFSLLIMMLNTWKLRIITSSFFPLCRKFALPKKSFVQPNILSHLKGT